MKLLICLSVLLILAQPAFAIGFGQPKTGIGMLNLGEPDDYRLGDTWGKTPVEDLNRATPAFRRVAMATARTGGATGFYLGKFEGVHVMATNHHVFERSCTGYLIRFPLLGVEAKCDRFFGTWPEIDLALFTIKFDSAADEAKVLPVAGNFQFHEDVQQGQRLLTIGFGHAGNPNHLPMANQDEDCYVFSKTAEYRLMGDPDELNPADYSAWSFSNGCDVSHGDSGSAMVDRDSGKVLGIIWTGRVPKSAAAQHTSYLTRMYQDQSEDLWKELSYAVPAKKMGEFLTSKLNQFDPFTKKVIGALLK